MNKHATPVKSAFFVRTTEGEREAIDEMVRQWAADRAAAAGGLQASGDTIGTWFRFVVRRLAAELDIKVNDAPPESVRRPKAAPKKPSAKKAAPKKARQR